MHSNEVGLLFLVALLCHISRVLISCRIAGVMYGLGLDSILLAVLLRVH